MGSSIGTGKKMSDCVFLEMSDDGTAQAMVFARGRLVAEWNDAKEGSKAYVETKTPRFEGN